MAMGKRHQKGTNKGGSGEDEGAPRAELFPVNSYNIVIRPHFVLSSLLLCMPLTAVENMASYCSV